MVNWLIRFVRGALDRFCSLLETLIFHCFFPFVLVRHSHGDACAGWYTYWSQRANNRPLNRGLRLDYFLVSSDMTAPDAKPQGADPAKSERAARLHDCWMSDATVGVSDHAPVLFALAL